MFSFKKIKVCGVAVCRVFNSELHSTKLHRSSHDMQFYKHQCSSKDSCQLNNSLKLGKDCEVSTIWLRENCRCRECYNIETQQRNVLFYRLRSKSFEIESLKEAGEGEALEVLWSDNHISCYDKEWLRSKLNNESLHFENKRFLWDSNSIQPYLHSKKVDYESLKHDKESLKLVCEDLYKYGFVQVDGVPASIEDTRKAVECVSSIRETFYGGIFEVSVEDNSNKNDFTDSAYSNVSLGLHTDGNYFSEPPAILALHFLRPAKNGGMSLFVDGFQTANLLSHLDPQAYHILETHLTNFSYKDGKRYLNQTCPTFETDQCSSNLKRIRYNHYDRSARVISSPSVPYSSFYEALSSFSKIVDDPTNIISLHLQPGTLLLIDNWRVLHGRGSFEGDRMFIGCYMERDKWMSNLTVL